jgi:signal transduction histidine kinase
MKISEVLKLSNCSKEERSDLVNNFKILLEGAHSSLDAIKKILENGAGFLPTTTTRLSLNSMISKIIRISQDSTQTKCKVITSLDGVPDFEANWLYVFLPILHVVENSFEAVDDNGSININGVFHDGIIELRISNDGKPIPQDIKENIFDNGFSSKGEKRGLGLKIAKSYLESINGEISLIQSNETETVFCIKFNPEAIYE